VREGDLERALCGSPAAVQCSENKSKPNERQTKDVSYRYVTGHVLAPSRFDLVCRKTSKYYKGECVDTVIADQALDTVCGRGCGIRATRRVR
jgi:hypothetical protein